MAAPAITRATNATTEIRSLRREGMWRLEAPGQAGGESRVQVNGFQQLFLGDFFVGRVRDVDGTRAEKKWLTPFRQHGNVRSEAGDHGGEIVNLPHADEGQ